MAEEPGGSHIFVAAAGIRSVDFSIGVAQVLGEGFSEEETLEQLWSKQVEAARSFVQATGDFRTVEDRSVHSYFQKDNCRPSEIKYVTFFS